MSVTESSAWKQLDSHFKEKAKSFNLNEMFEKDSSRFKSFSRLFKARLDESILFDFSKNLISNETFELLINLIKESKVEEWRNKMFNGKSTPCSWVIILLSRR